MKHPMLALGLGWILSTGPFLCAAPCPTLGAADDGTTISAPVAGGPQKDDIGNTVFSLIRANDLDRLTAFLDKYPAAIRDRAPNRDYPLHAAIDAGATDIAALLIKLGANLEGIDGRLATPLIVCAKKKDLVTADLLIKAQVKIDAKDTAGYTALHYAVQANQPEMVKKLLDAGASIDLVEPKKGWTPVHLACERGYTDLALQMIEAQFSETNFRCFFLLHKGSSQDLQQALTDDPRQMDVRVAGGWSLLHQAVIDNRLDDMTYLLSQGMDPFARDCTLRCALHYAAQAGKLDYVQRLMERHGDAAPDPNVVDEHKVTPLALAVHNNHLEICQFLLVNHANANIIDADGKNLAFDMATCDDKMAALLATAKMDLNLRDVGGKTPLYYALENVQRMQSMVKAGAKLDVQDNARRTLLHAAADAGYLESTQFLLQSGVAIDPPDLNKRTPLHLALIKGHGAIVNLLLSRGANIDAVDDKGATPMHYAIYHLDTLTALLKRHARIDTLSTKTKQTPLMVALQAHATDAQIVLNNYLRFFAAADSGKLADLQAVFTQLTADRDAALKDGNQALAKVLTETPASLIGARNKNGETPLLVAAAGGHVDAARFLFQCGADPKATRLDGCTGIHLAAAGNHPAMIALLLQKQVDVGVANAAQETALHLAAANNAVDAVKALIAAKANLTVVNQKGQTPLQVAQAAEHKEAAELLAAAAGGQ